MLKKKNNKTFVIKSRVGKNKVIDWNNINVSNNVPMKGEDITKCIYKQTGIKVTRQCISNAIKTSLKKIYISLRREDRKATPFEIALHMFQILYSGRPADDDAIVFFNLLPAEIREEIKRSAK